MVGSENRILVDIAPEGCVLNGADRDRVDEHVPRRTPWRGDQGEYDGTDHAAGRGHHQRIRSAGQLVDQDEVRRLARGRTERQIAAAIAGAATIESLTRGAGVALIVGLVGSFLGGFFGNVLAKVIETLANLYNSVNIFPPIITAFIVLWIYSKVSDRKE